MNTEALTAQTFLEKLRIGTAASHTKLEELPVSVSIMNPQVTSQEYALYLNLMQDVVADAEENVYPVLKTIITDLEDRKKNHFIKSDLEFLGTLKTGESIKPLTGANPNLTPAFALGIMYVVEGSSLGGRVILKNIKAALGYDEAGGTRYFEGYGGQTDSHWKSFLAMMTAYEAENENGDEIIAGADFAFDAISKHFTQNASR